MLLCVTFNFFLDANDALEYLNLSWNQFRSKATKEIALGLRVTLFYSIQLSSNLMLFNDTLRENCILLNSVSLEILNVLYALILKQIF